MTDTPDVKLADIPADVALEPSLMKALRAWREMRTGPGAWPGLERALATWRAAAVLRDAGE